MLHPFGLPVACYWVLLGVVAQYLKPIKRLTTFKRTQQLPTLLGVVSNVGSVGQQCCFRLHGTVAHKCNGETLDPSETSDPSVSSLANVQCALIGECGKDIQGHHKCKGLYLG